MSMDADAETLITSRNRISSRGRCYFARDFAMINVLLCVFVSFIACQPSSAISLTEQLRGNDPCGPSTGNYGSALSKVMLGDLGASCIRPNAKVHTAHGNVCTSSALFCFTSTLQGISSERPNNVELTSVPESFNDRVLPEVGASHSRECTINLSWSSDLGMSILVNGRTVVRSLRSGKSMDELSYIRTNSTSTVYQIEISSCRGPLLNQNSATFSVEDVEMIKSVPDSTSQIDIPCRDIIHLCNGKEERYGDSNHQSHNMGLGNKHIMSYDLLTSSSKVQAPVDSDEMVLRNWKSQGSDTQSSFVLDEDEVFFSVVPSGSPHSKRITVHNPSQHPVIMQILLNSGEIINNCRKKIDGLVGLVSSGRSLISKSQVPSQDGFSLAEDAIMEVIVNPFDKVSLGQLIFNLLKRCEWRSLVLVRNNLSGVEWLPVLGMGGSRALMIFEGTKPSRKIQFELKSPNPSDILDHNPMSTQPCSGPLTKGPSIVNLEDLTLEVRRISVSATDSVLDSCVVQNCSFFNLLTRKYAKLRISYQSEFLAPLVRRDLELALATGIFVLPLEATLPIIVIGECSRSLFWLRAKKIFAAVLVVAPCAFFIFCCFYPQALGFCAPYYFSNGDGETIPATTHKLMKSSKVQYSKKYGRFTSSTNAKHLPSLVDEDKASLLIPDDEGVVSVEHGIRVENGETRSCVENLETMLFTQEKPVKKELPSSLGQAENGVTEEPTLLTNLTVHIGKEKGRRRRKRKGVGPGLTALIEVSSSHSGNSTPSSPLSPICSTTLTPQRAWPKQNDVEFCLETQKAKSRISEPIRRQYSPKPTTLDQLAPTPSARPKATTKPILLPSATFPGNHLSSAARIAPIARAPGSRLCGETAANAEDEVKKGGTRGKEFTYDIWGDHFSTIDLIGKGRSRDDKYARMPLGIGIVDSDDSSNSFFVKGPMALLTIYQQELSGSNEK